MVEPLEAAAVKLDKELGEDIDIYVGKKDVTDVTGKGISFGALVMGGGSVAIGGTIIMTTIGGISASWTAYSAAAATAVETVTTVGAAQGFWAWIFQIIER